MLSVAGVVECSEDWWVATVVAGAADAAGLGSEPQAASARAATTEIATLPGRGCVSSGAPVGRARGAIPGSRQPCERQRRQQEPEVAQCHVVVVTEHQQVDDDPA